MNLPQHVLSFWFGDEFVDGFVAKNRDSLWFQSNPKVDNIIKVRFGPDHARAVSGQLDNWKESPRGHLALIILLDQFSRNIYRGTPRAFAHDPLARQLCLEGIASDADKSLRIIERTFFYLPLEHSEDINDQNLCVELMQQLVDLAPERYREKASGYLKYAVDHQKIIAEFGRFPHRNAILGRESTVEEAEFLQTGSSFGQ